MILDTSVIVAIIFQEPGHEKLITTIQQATTIGIGTPTITECGIVLSARLGSDTRALLSNFLAEIKAVAIPFTEEHAQTAVFAWRKYGKGQHPAALNFGDCLSYAIAKRANMPLLCVGNDFAQTDLEVA